MRYCRSFCDNCINKKDIREQLHKSRALEISTLWQRSVFLGAFIVLLFTGYGVYFDRMFFSSECVLDKMHFVGIVLGAVITIFGLLWIAMAKGSKRWSEIYEKKIDILENELKIPMQYRYTTECYTDTYSNAPSCHSQCQHFLPHNKGTDLLAKAVNEKKIFFDSDLYSPSKINIFIGLCIFICGIEIIIVHVFMVIKQLSLDSFLTDTVIFLWALLSPVIILCVAYLTIKNKLKHKIPYKKCQLRTKNQ